jgi:hypothetical protein
MDHTRDSFVVWLDPERVRAGRLTGSVEFVAGSERIRFHSAEELVAFLEQRASRAVRGDESPGD